MLPPNEATNHPSKALSMERWGAPSPKNLHSERSVSTVPCDTLVPILPFHCRGLGGTLYEMDLGSDDADPDSRVATGRHPNPQVQASGVSHQFPPR